MVYIADEWYELCELLWVIHIERGGATFRKGLAGLIEYVFESHGYCIKLADNIALDFVVITGDGMTFISASDTTS